MRVIFVEVDTERDWAVASIGPACLASWLREHGHDATLVRIAVDEAPESYVARVAAEAPDLLGFSMTSRQWLRGREVARVLKESLGIPILAGGLHATFAPESILASAAFDAVVLGEGEAPLLDVVTHLSAGTFDEVTIENVWRRGQPRPALRPPIEPLDRLPFIARDLLDEHYGVVHLTTQRGCPFPCTYCAARTYADLYAGVADYGRRRSHESVLDELDAIRANGPLNYVIYLDDTFTIDRHWVLAYLEKYRARGGVPFSVHARVETVDRTMVEALANAGCRHVVYGVESGSLRVRRDVMKRPVKNDRIVEVFQWTKDVGITVTANYMLGLPGETKDDLEETFALHERLEPFDFGHFVFYPYPGTALHRYCEEQGFLPSDWIERPAVNRASILLGQPLTADDIAAAYDRFVTLREQAYARRMDASVSVATKEQVLNDLRRCAAEG